MGALEQEDRVMADEKTQGQPAKPAQDKTVKLVMKHGEYHCEAKMDEKAGYRLSERIVKVGETFEVPEKEAERLVKLSVAERSFV
jgi:hypothetical protein